jgi:hypothetical protein
MKEAYSETSQPAAEQQQGSVRARFNVFISHAGPQKNFALWIRSHVRICGYRAFVDERDLQCDPPRQPEHDFLFSHPCMLLTDAVP